MSPQEIRARFEEEGYVVVEGVLDPRQDLAPVVAEYAELLDSLAERWAVEGKIRSPYRGLPFGKRLCQLAVETRGDYYDHFEITLPGSDITEETPIHLGPEVFHLLRNERLLDVVEILLGEEIYANPMQHARIKPPETCLPQDRRHRGGPGQTTWHQDQAGALREADETVMLTVWLPVVEATIENGCLAVAPGSHKRGLMTHCRGTIPDQIVGPQELPLPMKPGDVLLMSKQTMHRSLPNKSDAVRWSFDLRYNPVGQPTGRSFFPGFVARSRAHPESELKDPEAWADLWRETRSRLAGKPTPVDERERWDPGDPLCA